MMTLMAEYSAVNARMKKGKIERYVIVAFASISTEIESAKWSHEIASTTLNYLAQHIHTHIAHTQTHTPDLFSPRHKLSLSRPND